MRTKDTASKSNPLRLFRFLVVVALMCALIGFAVALPILNRHLDPVVNPYASDDFSATPNSDIVPVSALVTPEDSKVPEVAIPVLVPVQVPVSIPAPIVPVAEVPIAPAPKEPFVVLPDPSEAPKGLMVLPAPIVPAIKSTTASVESVPSPKAPVAVHVPILLYHYVRDTVHNRDITRYEMNVTPAIFEDQLKGLIDAGYHFVTMAQVSAALGGTGALPEKPIVLTFDDGLVDVYDNAFPILKKYQVPITAYLVPSLLNRKQYLTTAMAKEMAESGLVEIGSHSSHHLKLKTLSEVKARSEIADSKADLEKLLGVSVNTFAYPFGLYGEGHPKLVQEAGYASAASMIWTVARNTADPFQLPRLNIGERSGKELVAFLKGFK